MSGGLIAGRRISPAIFAIGAVLALPAVASATTRYAAPGGTASDTVCTSPAAPKCSIGAAAGGPDVLAADEAVILPGTYSEIAGDLGGDTGTLPTTVEPTAGTIHGVPGAARPVIVLDGTAASPNNNFFGAFFLGTSLTDVEIETGPGSTAASDVTQGVGSTIDRVVARSDVPNALVCQQTQGTIRDSACLSSGNGASALGASTFIGGTFTVNVRNVTAISTGTGSSGVFYFYATSSPPVGPTITISAKSLIAQGTTQDIRVRASGTGTVVNMNLDHSDYDSAIDEDISGGLASVTAPGTGTANIIAAPLLNVDGYHELAGSPTVNAGATDGNSGTQDIDGQLRQIGLPAPDIGADELGIPATTGVSCGSTEVGSPTTCTATVSDVAIGSISGTVSFSSDALTGNFAPASCTLPPALTTSQCQTTYTPAQAGIEQITGTYSGNSTHDPSQGTSPLSVTAPPGQTAPGGGQTGPGAKTPSPKKNCKKRKHRASAAKKKCRKKRR